MKKYINEIITAFTGVLDEVDIFVVDIDQEEFITYYFTINNLQLNVLESWNIKSIILILNQWDVAIFTKEYDRLAFNKVVSDTYFNHNINSSGSFLTVLALLRTLFVSMILIYFGIKLKYMKTIACMCIPK